MHRMHILLCKLRMFLIIFQPQITILAKSVISKIKIYFCLLRPDLHTSDYPGHEIVTIIMIATKTIMITMSMTIRGQ